MAQNPIEVLARLGGTATFAEILGHTSRRALRQAVARGEIEHLSKGVYGLPTALGMQKAAAAMHGVISHQSAARYWPMDSLFPASSLHVTVARNVRPVPRRGVVVHYANQDDVEVTSPLLTVLDCARTLPFREGLAIADSALRRDLIDLDHLVEAAHRLRGAGRKRALRVAEHADPRPANPFESALRAVVIEAGLTGFVPQLVIPGCQPQIRVDLGDPERKIVLEADSFAYHGSPQALEKDCRRYDELVCRGWRVLRFSYSHVIDDQEWTRDILLRTCRTTAARRTPPKIEREGLT